VNIQKLERIKELKAQRMKLDDEIKTLTLELTAEFTAELHGQRKKRTKKGAT